MLWTATEELHHPTGSYINSLVMMPKFNIKFNSSAVDIAILALSYGVALGRFNPDCKFMFLSTEKTAFALSSIYFETGISTCLSPHLQNYG